MSKESVVALFKAMAEDDELQARMVQVGAGAQESKQAMIEAITAAAAEEGYAFTSDELETTAQWREADEDGELSDEQLEMVAGGRGEVAAGVGMWGVDGQAGIYACLFVGINTGIPKGGEG